MIHEGIGAGAAPSVLMAMSGGVDSSVAASLLLEAGYRVMGATMKLFTEEEACLAPSQTSGCCSISDVEDAREVCSKLGIPHYTFNLRRQFKTHVMDKFCSQLMNGCTPNPCIDCNRFLKFDALDQRRAAMGLDYIATGHYVRRGFDEDSQKFTLATADDPSKDQTYALYNMPQDVLARTLFPVGELPKTEVRALAEAKGFGNARKPDSQDICFIPDGDIEGFLSRYWREPLVSGPIVDVAGNVLGEHRGLALYTSGQRKGLGVAAGEPLYVKGKSLEDNALIVGFADDVLVREVWGVDLSMISGNVPVDPLRVTAKMHYRQTPQPATVYFEQPIGCPTQVRVVFDEPQRPSSPGQAIVFYDGPLMLGGATITALG